MFKDLTNNRKSKMVVQAEVNHRFGGHVIDIDVSIFFDETLLTAPRLLTIHSDSLAQQVALWCDRNEGLKEFELHCLEANHEALVVLPKTEKNTFRLMNYGNQSEVEMDRDTMALAVSSTIFNWEGWRYYGNGKLFNNEDNAREWFSFYEIAKAKGFSLDNERASIFARAID